MKTRQKIEQELAAGEETIQCHFGRDVELAQGAEINLTFDPLSAVVLRDEALDDELDAA